MLQGLRTQSVGQTHEHLLGGIPQATLVLHLRHGAAEIDRSEQWIAHIAQVLHQQRVRFPGSRRAPAYHDVCAGGKEFFLKSLLRPDFFRCHTLF